MANEIPTGYSPLVLGDYTGSINAVGQQMVERQKERRLQHMQDAEKNQNLILKALDFEAVQGLSEKVSQEHLKMIEEIGDKWGRRYAEKQGRLNAVDLAELEKDKRGVEQEINNMKYNVLEMRKMQEALLDPLAPTIYSPESYQEAANYVQANDPRKSPMGILRPQFQPDIMADYLVKSVPEMSSAIEEINNLTYTTGYTNEQGIKRIRELVQKNPVVQNAGKVFGPAAVDQLLNSISTRYLQTKSEERLRPSSGSSYSSAQKEAELQSRAEKFNEIIYGISQGDKAYFPYLQEIIAANTGRVVSVKKYGNQLVVEGEKADKQGVEKIRSFDLTKPFPEIQRELGNLMISHKEYSDQDFRRYIATRYPSKTELDQKGYVMAADEEYSYDPRAYEALLDIEATEDIAAGIKKMAERDNIPVEVKQKGKSFTRVGSKYYDFSAKGGKKEESIKEVLSNIYGSKPMAPLPALEPVLRAIDTGKSPDVAKAIKAVLPEEEVDYSKSLSVSTGRIIFKGKDYDLKNPDDINSLVSSLAELLTPSFYK